MFKVYLPSSFGDDHFCADAVEFAPEVAVFQGDFNVLVHGVPLSRTQHPLVVRMGRERRVSSKLLALTWK